MALGAGVAKEATASVEEDNTSTSFVEGDVDSIPSGSQRPAGSRSRKNAIMERVGTDPIGKKARSDGLNHIKVSVTGRVDRKD
ncbi:hypothetical protein FOTG_18306 [Fusarium oxysporum f. sp. vasinfectum 25433]|uniref:Uncharacterized protein n=1 Tax=Fusarium oxysporum f. sp. vasinfectum 25433 TaxID=1089449 RepID=X0LXM9_FUSOX|nr:hypothetical protein FOTG_18306 [Fusarium oxysporum f. sp. vasinfectum 25433]